MKITLQQVFEILSKERAKREVYQALIKALKEYKSSEEYLIELSECERVPKELIIKASKGINIQGLEEEAREIIEKREKEYLEAFLDDYSDGGYAMPWYSIFRCKNLKEIVEYEEYMLISTCDFNIFELYEETTLEDIEKKLISSCIVEWEDYYIIQDGRVKDFVFRVNDDFKQYVVWLS